MVRIMWNEPALRKMMYTGMELILKGVNFKLKLQLRK